MYTVYIHDYADASNSFMQGLRNMWNLSNLKETEDKNQSMYFVRVALKSDNKTCGIKINYLKQGH